MAEHHSKELAENLLRLWELESKSTEDRAEIEFKKKAELFTENWMVKKEIKKQNISHMKETVNSKWETEIPGPNNVPHATLNLHHSRTGISIFKEINFDASYTAQETQSIYIERERERERNSIYIYIYRDR